MAELTRGAFLPPVQYRVRPDPVQNRVKVTILIVKRAETQRLYFTPLERLTETIIFTGSSILVFCLVFEKF